MGLSQEFASYFSPSYILLSQLPQIGDKAPSSPLLVLPADNGNPTILSFLRHCGCPGLSCKPSPDMSKTNPRSLSKAAEVAFLEMRTAAAQNPDINFIAISHSDQSSTDKWLSAVGGAGSVTVIVDFERELYALWGLGIVSWGHMFSPGGLMGIFRMGKDKGIWNRPTQSGSRWQSSGYWAVDGEGYVRWGGPAARVDDVGRVPEAIDALRGSRQG
ncbi:hypothetical protein N7520_010033 [Penicillium odoratum]|uniref:uncharacterized protein n=1 Tax=Penicillium odoratum TaxID=1167516 RepID=UPI0025495E29|nr:uncharacterized protein N7520_010033 [Penicillium odoratum]KAJ5753116.1 hypothetical protein N7520_010033 [Penicillium odoratum]